MNLRDRVVGLRRVPASELTANPLNFRTHPGKQRAALKGVLDEIGIAGALLAYDDPERGLTLIDGHLRKDEHPEMEWPVLVTDLTRDEANLLLAAHDPLSAMAGLDAAVLGQLLSQVKPVDAALQSMLEGLLPRRPAGPDDEAPIDQAEVLQTKWQTEAGQLWEIPSRATPGRAHRVLCGDSTDPETLKRLWGGVQRRLMVTDPPYGVAYDPTWRDEAGGKFGDGRTKQRGKVANDDRADWSPTWKLWAAAVAYVWHASLKTAAVETSLVGAGYESRANIIWRKPHFLLSRGNYHWQHEPCWYAVRKGAPSGWCGDRSQSTVWDIAGTNPAGRSRDEADEKTGHGTQKPVECMARPIRNHFEPGVVVADPFLGSGTTIVAAERERRLCYGTELSPGYVAVILERLVAMGLEPKLA